MSEIVIPKFPPTWDAWGAAGDRCCCDPVTTARQICCDGNFWFVSKYGGVGLLKIGSQHIKEVGEVSGYSSHICCGHYFVIYPHDRNTNIALWGDESLLYSGEIAGHSYECDSEYFTISLSRYTYDMLGWHKNTLLVNTPIDRKTIHCLQGKYARISDVAESGSDRRAALIYEGTVVSDEFMSYNCGTTATDTYYVVERGPTFNVTYALWYKGTQLRVDYVIFVPYGEYAAACPIIGRGGSITLIYKGIEIYTSYVNYFRGLYSGNEYIAFNSNAKTMAWFAGVALYESDDFRNISCEGDYLMIQTSETVSSVWYKGTKVLEIENASWVDVCTDYLILRKTSGDGVVLYKGELLYDGPYYSMSGCSNTENQGCVIRITSNTAIAYYGNEVVYEGAFNIYARWLGDFLVWDVETLKVWHKTKQIYDGAGSYSNCVRCGDFLIVHPPNATIVFHEDKQVEYEQEKYIDYVCCSERMYNTNDDETIDIWDTNYGKMKFDLNTFARLA